MSLDTFGGHQLIVGLLSPFCHPNTHPPTPTGADKKAEMR